MRNGRSSEARRCNDPPIPTASAAMAIPRPDPRLVVVGALAAAAFVAGLAADSFWLRVVAKPWPALAMMAWVAASPRGAYARQVAAALALCAVADVLLEFRETLFVHGIGVFLAAQLTLASAFTLHRRGGRPLEETAAALPFAAWLVFAFRQVAPGLGPMRGAVIAYMAGIGLMMWRAGAWFVEAPSGAAARLALAGAVVFGASDTMIALDRFDAPIVGARYLIILTYWAALAMIASSAIVAGRDDDAAAKR